MLKIFNMLCKVAGVLLLYRSILAFSEIIALQPVPALSIDMNMGEYYVITRFRIQLCNACVSLFFSLGLLSVGDKLGRLLKIPDRDDILPSFQIDALSRSGLLLLGIFFVVTSISELAGVYFKFQDFGGTQARILRGELVIHTSRIILSVLIFLWICILGKKYPNQRVDLTR